MQIDGAAPGLDIQLGVTSIDYAVPRNTSSLLAGASFERKSGIVREVLLGRSYGAYRGAKPQLVTVMDRLDKLKAVGLYI